MPIRNTTSKLPPISTLQQEKAGGIRCVANPPFSIAAYQIGAYSNQSGETLEGDIPLLMAEKKECRMEMGKIYTGIFSNLLNRRVVLNKFDLLRLFLASLLIHTV